MERRGMRLYLDTEFNGHNGELISLALAAEDGRHWYGYWGSPAPIESWVQVHVMPYIMAHEPLNLMRGSSIAVPDRALFRASLLEYLASRVGSTIYADWPDDFAHLMRVMS